MESLFGECLKDWAKWTLPNPEYTNGGKEALRSVVNDDVSLEATYYTEVN